MADKELDYRSCWHDTPWGIVNAFVLDAPQGKYLGILETFAGHAVPGVLWSCADWYSITLTPGHPALAIAEALINGTIEPAIAIDYIKVHGEPVR